MHPDAHQSLFAHLGLPESAYTEFNDIQPGTFGPQLLAQPDGDPIVGLHYAQTRVDEEVGLTKLRTTLTGDDPHRFHLTEQARSSHCAEFRDANALTLALGFLRDAPKWGTPTGRRDDTSYARAFTRNLGWSRGARGEESLRQTTVPQLLRLAKELGVTAASGRRQDLVDALCASEAYTEPGYGWRWPGWFGDNETLVLRADTGVTSRVLSRLREATRKGTLAYSPWPGPCSTGLFLYDAQDETAAFQAERTATVDWLAVQMAAADEVRAELRRSGVRVWLLGYPEERDGEVVFAFNASIQGRQQGVHGAYTLEQLRAGAYLAAA